MVRRGGNSKALHDDVLKESEILRISDSFSLYHSMQRGDVQKFQPMFNYFGIISKQGVSFLVEKM